MSKSSIRIEIKDTDLHQKVKIYAAKHNMKYYEAYERLVRIGLKKEKEGKSNEK